MDVESRCALRMDGLGIRVQPLWRWSTVYVHSTIVSFSPAVGILYQRFLLNTHVLLLLLLSLLLLVLLVREINVRNSGCHYAYF